MDCGLMYRSTSQVIVETNMAETAIKRTARGAAQAGHASSRDHQVPSAASRRRDRDDAPLVQWWSAVGRSAIAMVGGKNASLDEMIDQLRDAGSSVPGGVATTATDYWQLIEANDLAGQLAGKLRELQKDGRKGSGNTQVVPIEKDRVWSRKFKPLETARVSR